MTLDIEYSAITPKDKDVCVVYCYYNPGGDPVVLKNALELESKLTKANIPYFNAEVLVGNATPSLTNPSLTLKTHSSLFYKESAWNLIENIIPVEFTKICFMEVNVRYNNPKWLELISHMLNFYPLVKPYTSVYSVDVEGNTSPVDSALGDGSIFGIKRDMLRKINGFFDKGVLVPDTLNKAINHPDTRIGIPMLESEYASYTTRIKDASCKLHPVSTILYLLYNGVVSNIRVSDCLKNAYKWDCVFSLNENNLWELKDDMLDNTFKSIYPVCEPVVMAAAVVPEPVVEPVVVAAVVPVPVVVAEPVVPKPAAVVVPEPVAVPVVPKPAAVVMPPVVPVPVVPVPAAIVMPVPMVPVPVAMVHVPVAHKHVAKPVSKAAAPILQNVNIPVAVRNEQARMAAAALISKFMK